MSLNTIIPLPSNQQRPARTTILVDVSHKLRYIRDPAAAECGHTDAHATRGFIYALANIIHPSQVLTTYI